MEVRRAQDLPSEPSPVTIIQDASGWSFASLVVQTSTEPLPETPSDVGIDLGLARFAVLLDGSKVTVRPPDRRTG